MCDFAALKLHPQVPYREEIAFETRFVGDLTHAPERDSNVWLANIENGDAVLILAWSPKALSRSSPFMVQVRAVNLAGEAGPWSPVVEVNPVVAAHGWYASVGWVVLLLLARIGLSRHRTG
jgi:hypothetical protein